MNYNIYHTELDSLIYESIVPGGEEPSLYHSKELKFLFCTHDGKGPMININDTDINNLEFCLILEKLRRKHNHLYHNHLCPDHKKLYDYLVDVGLGHIRFVPLSEDDSLDYGNSFTLYEWS